MREIIFRGKRRRGGAWIEGYLVRRPSSVQYDGNVSPWAIHTPPKDPEDLGYVRHVDPETVGQFTGLTDKNGKRIFEGDIGRYKQTDGAMRNGKPIICTGAVIYNAETASYAVGGADYFDYFPIRDFEIIGNIHDNPELLSEREGEK